MALETQDPVVQKRDKFLTTLLDAGYSPAEAGAEWKKFEAEEAQKKNPAEPLSPPAAKPKAEYKLPDGYEEPEWFAQSGFDYKQDKKIRTDAINRVTAINWQATAGEVQMLPTEAAHVKIDESDLLTPEMVSEIDLFARSADKDGLDMAASKVRQFREDMVKKHNPGGSKVTNRNIDILIEESLAPKIAKEVEDAIVTMQKNGKSKRDIVLADPKMIKEIKSQFIQKGWTGDIVDQAFYKAIDEKKDDYLYNSFLDNTATTVNTIAKNSGRGMMEVANEVGAEIEKDRVEYAMDLFGRDELKRRQMVERLEYLKKNPEQNLSKIAATEAEIKTLQSRMQLDARVDWLGTIGKNMFKAPNAGVNVALRYTHGAYDENGNKLMHGKMSDEEKAKQAAVSEEMNNINENPNMQKSATIQAQKQYGIINDLKLAKEQTVAEMNAEIAKSKDLTKDVSAYIPGDPNMGIRAKYEPKLRRINELQHQAEVKFEAYSRIELLNENVAMTDKTVGYYLGEAGAVLANKNNMRLFKNITTEAQMVDVSREMYQEMGVQMDEAELKNTAPDLMMDITRGGAELTDFALKMVLLDKAMGVKGLMGFAQSVKNSGVIERAAANFFAKSSTRLEAAMGARGAKMAEGLENIGLSALKASATSPIGKITSNVIGAGAEGAKFAAISSSHSTESKVGGFETGVAFYEIGKLMPNLFANVANPYIKVIGNGIVRSSMAMTASMEAVAAYDAARNAIANDKDFERAMEEAGIIGWGEKDEVFRRVVTELVTAVPFGMRALGQLKKSGYIRTTFQEFDAVAKDMLASKDPNIREMGIKLQTALLDGITPAGSKKAFEIKEKIEYLKENERYDPTVSIEKNLEIYKEVVAELGYNPITDQMLEVHNGKKFETSIIEDVLTRHEKIEYLKSKKLVLDRMNKNQVDKLYEEQKAADMAAERAERVEIAYAARKFEIAANGEVTSPAPRYKSKEELELAELKKEIGDTKKEDVDWDKFSKDSGTKMREIFSKVRERIGEDKFIDIINTAIGITKTARGGSGLEFSLIPKEGFTNKEAFDRFVDQMQSMRSDNFKIDALNRIEFMEEILQRVESIAAPKPGFIRTVSNVPSPKSTMITLSEIELLKNQIRAYQRGSKEGRADYEEKITAVREYVKENAPAILELLKDTKMTPAELVKLTDSPKAKDTDADILERLDKLGSIINKIEMRAVKNRISGTIRRSVPKIVGSEVRGEKVDFVTSLKLSAIESLWNGDVVSARTQIARLEVLRNDALKNGKEFEADLYEAQIAALYTTGNRELALDRQYDLNSKIDAGIKLSRAERMELELLDFNDGKRMSQVDLFNAERNLNSIMNHGKNIREMNDIDNKIRREAEVQLGIESLHNSIDKGVKDAADIRADIKGERRSEYLKAKAEADMKLLQFMHNWRGRSESFYTLMEHLMRNQTNRATGEGLFHGITSDIFRAREHQGSMERKMNAERVAAKARIFGVDSKKLEKINKEHTKPQPLEITIDGRKQVLDGKRTVNQVYKIWQSTLMESNSSGFQKMGWGVELKPGESAKYNADLLRSELEAFLERYSPVGKKVVDYARWQVEEFFPEYYPRLNEAYRAKNGVDMMYEVNYTPTIRELDAEGKQIVVKDLLSGDGSYFVQAMTPSGFKVKSKNANSPINTEIDGEMFLERYVNKMEHFINFQPVIDRMNNMFGNKDIRHLIEKNNSRDFNKIIDEFITDIASDNARLGQTEFDKILDTVRRRFVQAHLGLNLSLFPKQLVAVPAYLHAVGGMDVARVMKETFVPTKDMVVAITELMNSDFIKNRIKSGSYDKDVIEVITHLNKRAKEYDANPNILTGDWRQDMLITTKLGDLYTILWGGQAVYRVKTEQYKKEGLSEVEAKQKAYQDFLKSTTLTQASGNIEDQSYWQRMGSVGKFLTLFQNTPLQYYRIEAMAITNMGRAVTEMQKAPSGSEQYVNARKKATAAAKDFAIYHFVLPALFNAASQGFYIGEDSALDDPDMLRAMALGSFSYIFLGGNVLETAADLLTTDRSFGVNSFGVLPDVADNLTKTIETFTQMGELLDGDPITSRDIDTKLFDAAKPVIATVSEMTGLPLVSASVLTKGVVDFVSGKTDDVRSLFGYSGSVTGKYKRSPDYIYMEKHINSGNSADEFLRDIKQRFTKEEYDKSKTKLEREYKMYQHFGGDDPIVNQLYRGGLTNQEKADYLIKIRRGKWVKPTTLATITISEGMTPQKFDKLVSDLKKYKVISSEVEAEIKKQLKTVKYE